MHRTFAKDNETWAIEIRDFDLIETWADFRSLARSPHLKKLTTLALNLSDFGDEGLSVIVESGLLARLEELDLSDGCITDVGARILSGSHEYQHLKVLKIMNNRLTREGVRALRREGLDLKATGQQRRRDGFYTDEYLYEGGYDSDWE